MFRRTLSLLASTGSGMLAVQSAYQLLLLASGVRVLGRPEKVEDRELSGPLIVFVPAHDEVGTIETALASFAVAEHPPAGAEIIVVADNCSDSTAEVARSFGVTVWERTDVSLVGKGHALSWALDRLSRDRPDHAAVVFVDADCVVDPTLLCAIASALADADAVQADNRVSNLDESTLSALRGGALLLINTLRGAGREGLGISAGLMGTGMGLTRETLAAVPWRASGIIEDAEQHLRLVQSGRRVRFLPQVAVWSPMPVTTAQALSQEERWEGGRFDLLRRVSLPLAKQAVVNRDGRLLLTAAETLMAPQSLVAAATLASGSAGLALRSRWLLTSTAFTAGAQVVYVVGGLFATRAPASVWKAMTLAPSIIVRKLALFGRLLARGAPADFVRTERVGPKTTIAQPVNRVVQTDA